METITAESTVPENLSLPGIDLEDGLERLRGNWKSYRRILLSFKNKQADAADRLEAFIGEGNWEEATRLSHTLKGSGGNLGGKQLYAAASTLEQTCLNADDAAVQGQLENLRTCLLEVIDGLAQLDEDSGVMTK